jgi:hypothetical protein
LLQLLTLTIDTKISKILEMWCIKSVTYKSMTKAPKKDYAYRSTWKHKFSRARNLAHRGGLTKKQMLKKYGRFPKKNEWWGEDRSYKKWKKKWIIDNPNPKNTL